MNIIDATPATLAALGAARDKAENELRKMRRINSAFKLGRRAFLQSGFPADDFQKFADIIARYPKYGAVPFPPRFEFAKIAQIERLQMEIVVGAKFLTPANAG